jgi:cytoskeleton protein RodZ
MTEETTIPHSPSLTAGALLRQYRETFGLKVDALAHALRVAPAKLEALEGDRLDELPDAMFARALALAVCRQLRADAAPVLALLPGQDVSRLAPKDERGLDFPLDRPSFLPQSSFLLVSRLFTPMRWAALAVLVFALILGLWPEIHALLVFKDEPAAGVLDVPVASPVIALPTTEELAPVVDAAKSGNMVVTTVQSNAATATAAVAGASATGAPDAR